MKLRWLQALLVGVVLFAAADVAERATGNPNFFPTMILLGAFTIPVAFVIFFYEHVRDRDISISLLAICFLGGGAIGLVAAGVLEYSTLQSLGVGGLIGVGVIEESAKLIFPVAMFIGWRYRHEADGLLFGVSAGMGFAALETMGYGLVSLVQSQGDVTALQQTLLIRGLLSPAGHAAWCGLICSVLWKERQRLGKISIGLPVVGVFVLAIVLHSSWDIINSANISSTLGWVGMGALSVLSLGLLLLRYFDARKLSAPSLEPGGADAQPGA